MSERTTEPWRVREEDFPRNAPLDRRASFLLRYAILAPSSHNSQPWRFGIQNGRIDVYADHSRWLRVADADKRELYLSVGCALENLVVAAQHFGLLPRVEHVGSSREPTFEDSTVDGSSLDDLALVARVHLTEAEQESGRPRPEGSGLFQAIIRRHTNHGEYDGRPVPDAVRKSLGALAVEPAVEIHFTSDPEVRRRVDELTARADALQFADPEWRRELGRWLGRGVFGTGWIMSKMSQLAVTHLNLAGSVSRKDRDLLRSASLLGLVAARETDRESRVRAGQVFERLFLAATSAGLALQPMNQILQVDETRGEFRSLLPKEWGEPQITFRLGYAESEEHTPRRPVREVLMGDGGSPESNPALEWES